MVLDKLTYYGIKVDHLYQLDYEYIYDILSVMNAYLHGTYHTQDDAEITDEYVALTVIVLLRESIAASQSILFLLWLCNDMLLFVLIRCIVLPFCVRGKQ